VDEPGVRRRKAARVEVERGEGRLEVDVEPLAACGLRVKCTSSDDLGSYSLALAAAARVVVD
jgi:hypothetical protein